MFSKSSTGRRRWKVASFMGSPFRYVSQQHHTKGSFLLLCHCDSCHHNSCSWTARATVVNKYVYATEVAGDVHGDRKPNRDNARRGNRSRPRPLTSASLRDWPTMASRCKSAFHDFVRKHPVQTQRIEICMSHRKTCEARSHLLLDVSHALQLAGGRATALSLGRSFVAPVPATEKDQKSDLDGAPEVFGRKHSCTTPASKIGYAHVARAAACPTKLGVISCGDSGKVGRGVP